MSSSRPPHFLMRGHYASHPANPTGWIMALFMLVSLLSPPAMAGLLTGLPLFSGVDLKQVEAEHPGVPRVDIRYLGVGGYLIKWGEDEIMMAPSFSNPDPLSLLFNTRPNPKIIDRMIPNVSDVDMILVGHAHYDHLLDVPYVMNKYAKKAKVYGSKTMKHLIASQVSASRIGIVEDKAATAKTPGEWVYNPSGRIRFMAIKSDHAPNASLHGAIKTAWGTDYEWDWFFNVSEGNYDKDLDRMPLSAFEWKEGQSLAYIVDFLDANGNIAFRFHYADACSTPDKGFIPTAVLNEKAVDMGILTVANYDQISNDPSDYPAGIIPGYPEGIVDNLKANHYVLGHWENFFGNTATYPWPFDKVTILPLSVVPLTNAHKFLERLKTATQAPFTFPKPGAQMTFIVE